MTPDRLTESERQQLRSTLSASESCERAGDLPRAMELLLEVVDALASKGQHRHELVIRLARLAARLGKHEEARAWLDAARTMAAEAGIAVAPTRGAMRAIGASLTAFVTEIEAIGVELMAGAVDAAGEMLARLDGGHGTLGPPSSITAADAERWLLALSWPGHKTDVVRVDVGLALARFLHDSGRFRTAADVLGRILARYPVDRSAPDRHQVTLLRAEALVAAGQLEAAAQVLADPPPAPFELAATRWELVRIRCLYACGRFGEAHEAASRLPAIPPGVPQLVVAAAVTRIAVAGELNRFREVLEIHRDHAVTFDLDAREALAGAVAAIELRARASIASWELAWLPEHALRRPERPATGRAAVELLEQLVVSNRASRRWCARWNLLLVALEDEAVAAARDHLHELRDAARAMESRYVELRVEFAEALVRYYHPSPGVHTDPAGMVEVLCEVAEGLQQIGARHASLHALRYAAWAAARRGDTAGHRRLAAEVRARIHSIASDMAPSLAASYLLDKWEATDEYVDALLASRAKLAQERRSRQLSSGQAVRLFCEVDRITRWPVERGLDVEGSAELSSALTPGDVAGWVDRQRAIRRTRPPRLRSWWSLWRLPPRTIVLHYHVLPDRIALFRFALGHGDLQVLPYVRPMLDGDVEAVHQAIAAGQDRDADDILSALAQDLGITEALARWPSARRMVVVAHDAIANVPFPALLVGKQRLCQRISIAQLDTIDRLRRCRRAREPTLRAMGIEVFPAPFHDRLAPISTMRDELGGVAAHYRRAAPPLVNQQVTAGAVLAELAAGTHVHVVTHGEFSPDNPHESGFWVHDGATMRPLTLRELSRIDGSRLDLVTIPMCWSAEAAQLPGRERICLPTALLDSGAQGVVAALWRSEPGANARFMPRFHAQVGAYGAAAALARTQAEFAAASASKLRQWASFVFYGNG